MSAPDAAPAHPQPMAQIILLTAPIRSGKTTACERLVERARAEGLRLGGILAPARYDAEGVKAGFDVVDLLGGERRALARVEQGDGERTVGEYAFAAEVMDWALERAMVALGRPLDLVIVDEIGPLELRRRGGFAPLLEELPRARAATVILIVRSGLLEALRGRLRSLSPVTVALNADNRDSLPEALYAIVEAAAAP